MIPTVLQLKPILISTLILICLYVTMDRQKIFHAVVMIATSQEMIVLMGVNHMNNKIMIHMVEMVLVVYLKDVIWTMLRYIAKQSQQGL